MNEEELEEILTNRRKPKKKAVRKERSFEEKYLYCNKQELYRFAAKNFLDIPDIPLNGNKKYELVRKCFLALEKAQRELLIQGALQVPSLNGVFYKRKVKERYVRQYYGKPIEGGELYLPEKRRVCFKVSRKIVLMNKILTRTSKQEFFRAYYEQKRVEELKGIESQEDRIIQEGKEIFKNNYRKEE